jgi:hypothetical protein
MTKGPNDKMGGRPATNAGAYSEGTTNPGNPGHPRIFPQFDSHNIDAVILGASAAPQEKRYVHLVIDRSSRAILGAYLERGNKRSDKARVFAYWLKTTLGRHQGS